jgi:hypothetical protein
MTFKQFTDFSHRNARPATQTLHGRQGKPLHRDGFVLESWHLIILGAAQVFAS